VFGLILILSGCISQSPTCNKPYILVGNNCCLDENADSICDKDKLVATTLEEITTTTIEEIVPTSTSIPTTTTIEVTTTSTNPDYIQCMKNSDCGVPRNGSIHCVGKEIQGTIVTPSCKNPGELNAKCIDEVVTRNWGTCEHYCSKGECYPEHCLNNWLDPNEEEVDCGRECPPCEEIHKTEPKRCVLDGECGTNYYKDEYGCYNGNVVRYKVVFTCTENNTCSNETERIVKTQCEEGYTCIDGDSKCINSTSGSCNDCIKNQDEEGIDCGGSCRDCASSYTKGNIDLYNLRRVVEYRGYTFRYIQPIFIESMYGICNYGAEIKVGKPNGYIVILNVTRYDNYKLDNLNIAFVSADDKSAKLAAW
jgi:hypothetical protein